MTWTLQELLRAVEGTPAGSPPPASFTAVCTDSRALTRGCVFVPLSGERFDGHDFVGPALRGGAALALWGRPEIPAGLPRDRLIRVADPLTAYQALGRHHLHRLGIPVVAITGSVGKTTTKDLCAALLGARYRVHRSHANYNNQVGVPRTLLELQPDHEVAVLELAMRGPGQIAELARGLEARVGVITSVGESHYEFLGSQEAIADAKGELLEHLAPDGVAVLPADTPFLGRLRSRAGSRRVLTFSASGPADVTPRKVRSRGLEGWEAEVEVAGAGRCRLRLPLPGRHNLANLLAAMAAATAMGLSPEECARGAEALQLSPLRSEVFRTCGGIRVFNDSYNAAPASMAAALRVLEEVPPRRVAVLGDMLELGTLEEEGHRRVGRLAAACGVQLLVAVGERSRVLAEAARAGGVGEVLWAPDPARAWELLRARLRPGDTVLLKASRAVGLEVLCDALRGLGGDP